METCCRYSLELPSRGTSNEFLQYIICFHGEVRIIVILFSEKKSAISGGLMGIIPCPAE